MSSRQRSEVWLGTRKKTSGGLTKADLTKNKRGKIVSKKKSEQASSQNNLGSWLRETGKKVEKADMLRKKSEPPADAPASKAKKAAPKKAAAKAVPKAKPAPKAAPKKAPVAQPKKQPKVVRKQALISGSSASKKPAKQAAPKRKKVKKKSNINPITQQPYEKKSGLGYVNTGAVSLDNLKRQKMKPRKKIKTVADYNIAW